jgi:hypothetical protein
MTNGHGLEGDHYRLRSVLYCSGKTFYDAVMLFFFSKNLKKTTLCQYQIVGRASLNTSARAVSKAWYTLHNFVHIPQLCTHYRTVYIMHNFAHVTQHCTHSTTSYTLQNFVHNTQLCTRYTTLYTFHNFVHITELCTHYRTLYIIHNFAHITQLCTRYTTLYTLNNFVHITQHCTHYTTMYTIHNIVREGIPLQANLLLLNAQQHFDCLCTLTIAQRVIKFVQLPR